MGNKELNRLLGKVVNENSKISFDRIFDYYYPKLVDFADLYLESRELAEEVASDVLLKLFIRRKFWLFVDKPEAYLYKSVKNLSISQLRKKKKNSQLTKLHKNPDDSLDVQVSPERLFLEEEFYKAVVDIIEGMPPRRKLIFKFIKEEGKSYKEVAGLLNISVKTVEVHMGLAISHIRNSLEKYDKQNNFNYLRLVKSLVAVTVGLLEFF